MPRHASASYHGNHLRPSTDRSQSKRDATTPGSPAGCTPCGETATGGGRTCRYSVGVGVQHLEWVGAERVQPA
jgi:hypothetical protein